MIKVNFHPFFNEGKELQEEVAGRTVGECLKGVTEKYPFLTEKLFEKNGKLKGYVEVLVNGKGTMPYELAYEVKEGDSIYILAMLSGG